MRRAFQNDIIGYTDVINTEERAIEAEQLRERTYKEYHLNG